MKCLKSLLLIKQASVLPFGWFFLMSLANPSSAQELVRSETLDGKAFEVSLVARDAQCLKSMQILMGRTMCIAISVKSSDPLWLKGLKLERFDAVMPEHRHGMVTKPKINALSSTEYLIEGVKLHMPGKWQFNLNFVHGKSATQVAIPVKL